MCLLLRSILKGTPAWALPCPLTALWAFKSTHWVREPGTASLQKPRVFVDAGTGSSSSAGLREAAAWHRANRGTVELQRTVPLCPEKAPVGAQRPLRPTPAALGLELGWSLGSWLRPHRLPAVHRVTLSLFCTPDSIRSPGRRVAPARGPRVCLLGDPNTPPITLSGRNPSCGPEFPLCLLHFDGAPKAAQVPLTCSLWAL